MSDDFRNSLSGDPLNDAALWHERLRQTDTEKAIWVWFTEWLEADADHRAAYDKVEALYGELDEMAALTGVGFLRPSYAAVLPLPREKPRRIVWIAAVGSALIAASVLVTVVVRPRPAAIEHFITAPGETRHILAGDGSVLDLNGGTSISITLSPGRRQVQLDRGEILIQVAADPQRPFVVAAGRYEIRDVGTVFDVVRTEGLAVISVAQGRVSVSEPGGASQPVLLSAGERLEHRDGGDSTLRPIDPAAAGSWKNGYLVYEDAALSQVVADVGRYGSRKILLQGPDSSFRHFSGILKIDTQDAMLERLGQLLSLSIDRAGDGPVLVRAVSPAK